MAWTSLCDLSELQEGQGKLVQAGGRKLAVFLSGGKAYVMDNACPHAGGDLAEGWVEAGCVVCPLHCWPFRLDDGQLRDQPAVSVQTYPTRVLEREGQTTVVQADVPTS